MKTKKWYITKKDDLGYRHAEEKPLKDMTGVDVVELPDAETLEVISRGKRFLAYKVALAVAAGQIKVEDVRA